MNPLTKKGSARRLFNALHKLPSDPPKEIIVSLYNEAMQLRNPATYHPLLEILIGQLIWKNAIPSIKTGALNLLKPKYDDTVIECIKTLLNKGWPPGKLHQGIPDRYRTGPLLNACTEYSRDYRYLLRCFNKVKEVQ